MRGFLWADGHRRTVGPWLCAVLIGSGLLFGEPGLRAPSGRAEAQTPPGTQAQAQPPPAAPPAPAEPKPDAAPPTPPAPAPVLPGPSAPITGVPPGPPSAPAPFAGQPLQLGPPRPSGPQLQFYQHPSLFFTARYPTGWHVWNLPAGVSFYLDHPEEGTSFSAAPYNALVETVDPVALLGHLMRMMQQRYPDLRVQMRPGGAAGGLGGVAQAPVAGALGQQVLDFEAHWTSHSGQRMQGRGRLTVTNIPGAGTLYGYSAGQAPVASFATVWPLLEAMAASVSLGGQSTESPFGAAPGAGAGFGPPLR